MKAPQKILSIVVVGLLTANCGGNPNRSSTLEGRQVSNADKSERSLTTAARVSEQIGDYALAVDYFRKLYEKDQNNLNTIVGLSRNLRYGSEGAKARLFMDMIVERGVDGPKIRAEYGKAQLADGFPDRAVGSFTRAISLGDGSWQTYSALGAAQDRLENYEGAQEAYATALQISPENPMILNNKALSLSLSGKLKAAIELLEGAVSHPGATSILRQNLAMLHALNGDEKAAKSLGRFDLSDNDVQKNLEYYQAIREGNGAIRRQ